MRLYYNQDFQACACVTSSEGFCVAPIDNILTELIMYQIESLVQKD